MLFYVLHNIIENTKQEEVNHITVYHAIQYEIIMLIARLQYFMCLRTSKCICLNLIYIRAFEMGMHQ